MKLRSLRLHGFKSFADRTSIEFRDGVTAVVGSNGCGKSNVADAIRWVLGEQRASVVRGAKMDEVIFQGTSKRRPLNFAEVVLGFDNTDGRVAIPQSEIEIARKVFRESGSEYSLNQNACRLRDIQALLRDTGLGANSYSIIEAAMIESLLSDRAEERRVLFEEAAGVGRYKDSRTAATRRLTDAEADLARLDDVIVEVGAKVRSLARQSRKAERHAELRARRRDIEVALAAAEADETLHALAEGEHRCAELDRGIAAAAAERSTAEMSAEAIRTANADRAGRRAVLAPRAAEVRQQLEAREREILVADERRSHAEMRIAQVAHEREQLDRRLASLVAEREHLAYEQKERSTEIDQLRVRHEQSAAETEQLRATLFAARERSEQAAASVREVARARIAAEGRRDAAQRRAAAAEQQLRSLSTREQELAAHLAGMRAQADERTEAVARLRERSEIAARDADFALDVARQLQTREVAARDALRRADDHVARLASQVAAREALEATYEGFAPAVAAIMTRRQQFPGVRDVLASSIDASAGGTAGRDIEQFLGPLLQAVVVDDLATARAVRRWFREHWKGGGSLILLPADAPALRCDPPGARDADDSDADAAGAAWAELLLADLIPDEADPLERHRPGAARVGAAGEVIDTRGAVRLAEHDAEQGILSRRSVLARLRVERDAATVARDAYAADRAAAADAAAVAEQQSRTAVELHRGVAAELRAAEIEISAHAEARARAERECEEVMRSLRTQRSAAAEAAEQLAAATRDLERLQADAEHAAEAESMTRAARTRIDAAWEELRERDSELRIALARAEAEWQAHARRVGSADAAWRGAGARRDALDAEGTELRATLIALVELRERASADVERLFAERDRRSREIGDLDARLQAAEAEVALAERAARAARQRESTAAEERHALDLRNAEHRAHLDRIRVRLEAEWGRAWDALLAEAQPVGPGTPEQREAELRQIAAQLAALGPVNALAAEEHAEEEARLAFLDEQRTDLVRARDDLTAAIRQINRTAREIFMATFATIRDHFHRTFDSLFPGGECDIWLTDADDPLESPVEIHASPQGKRTQRIHLLSGGERTLTALALLFALYLVKPSPFCVLDEVDAPLDESNVGRFIQLLHDFKRDTQFIVITHNPRTMEAADWIYGVTMEEPGVSAVVGVELLGNFAIEDQVA